MLDMNSDKYISFEVFIRYCYIKTKDGTIPYTEWLKNTKGISIKQIKEMIKKVN